MTRRPGDAPRVRPIDIVTATAVMAALVVLVGKAREEGRRVTDVPAVRPDAQLLEPIASEADVFALRSTELGVAPDLVGDGSAHVRSFDMYRRLRAYPGAPPRIPHGLTDREFTSSSCNTCHQRGGWVARFGTYAPVTPHPDQASCLQCHVPRDELVGRPYPSPGGGSTCAQCHVDPDAQPELFAELGWVPADWPATGVQAMPGSPHRIPHGFQLRGNCLACHSGPGAVAELRTDHPERANCRQCHVPVGSYTEPFPRVAGDAEGAEERAP